MNKQNLLVYNYNILYDILHLPYFFEDGICENVGNNYYNEIDIFSRGMKIFNFHPLNTYINSSEKKHRDDFLFKISDFFQFHFNEVEKGVMY